jgi:drug/metabolite transporter (DMT)-like permease
MIPAIIATFVGGMNEVFDKIVMNKKRMSSQKFITMIYLGTFLFMLPIIFFYFRLSYEMFNLKNTLLMIGMVATAIAFASFYFKGFKHTKVEKAEPLALTTWLFTIFITIIFFPDEREWKIVILALICAITLLALNIKKRHLSLDKYGYYILIGSFLWSVHLLFLKELLEIYNPMTLTFVRAGIISLVLIPVYGITKKDLIKGRGSWLAVISILNVLSWVLILWSYSEIGIVYTSLIMSASPLVAEWGATIFLKEKLHRKNLIGTVIIVLCIVLSMII